MNFSRYYREAFDPNIFGIKKKMVLYSSQKILQMHSTRKNEKVLVKMVI